MTSTNAPADDSSAQSSGGSLLSLAAIGGILAGVAFFGAALVVMTAKTPPPAPLWVALFVIGFSDALCSFLTTRRKRLAWSFATSLNGTMALVMLLAAPKLRDIVDVPLIIAVLPAVYLTVVTSLLAVSAPELEA